MTGLEGIVYVNDLIVYAESLTSHMIKLKKALGRLKTARLTLLPEKCLFRRKKVAYLGHVITAKRVKPDRSKVSAVSSFLTH